MEGRSWGGRHIAWIAGLSSGWLGHHHRGLEEGRRRGAWERVSHVIQVVRSGIALETTTGHGIRKVCNYIVNNLSETRDGDS